MPFLSHIAWQMESSCERKQYKVEDDDGVDIDDHDDIDDAFDDYFGDDGVDIDDHDNDYDAIQA